MDTKLISIITVVYNDHEGLLKTIESIKNQPSKFFEYIIIDGGSKDGTLDLILQNKKMIDFFISEPDNGIYDAMNKGIKQSSSKYLYFLNAGDTLVNDAIFERMSEYSDYDIIYGNHIANGKVKVSKKFNTLNLLFWGTKTVCHQSIFFKKNIHGFFSNNYVLKSEYDKYLELSNKNISYKHINIPICNYNLEGTGIQRSMLNLLELIKVIYTRYNIFGILIASMQIIYIFLKRSFR